eukprot:26638-Chlamydomonas_euryale.AAC.1
METSLQRPKCEDALTLRTAVLACCARSATYDSRAPQSIALTFCHALMRTSSSLGPPGSRN